MLRPGEIHLWLIDLDQQEPIWELLDGSEREKADRLRFEIDRRRFVTRHSNLRQVLGQYLQRPAAEIAIGYNRYGKPKVDGLEFSASSSAEFALLGFSRDRLIGVDIEVIRPEFPWEEAAEVALAAAELADLRRLPESDRARGFLQQWTQREAFGKAVGTGLSAEQEGFHDGHWGSLSFQPNDRSVASLVWRR